MDIITFNTNSILSQNTIKQNNNTIVKDAVVPYIKTNATVNTPDIALIECFWGNDVNRIHATTTSIKSLLSSNSLPSDWIFVEAQTNSRNACFSWVKQYGIKYIFKKIGKNSQDIWLKMPLWNIGVNNTKCNKLCFIDADVSFEDKDWLNAVSEGFKKYDVLSLAGHIQHVNSICEDSIGYKVLQHAETNDNKFGFCYGHMGYTLGLNRKSYEMLGKFDAVNYLDDQWFWMKVFGYKNDAAQISLLPYKPIGKAYEYGYPLKVGSTELICLVQNSSDKTKLYQFMHDLSYENVEKQCDDISYDDINELPEWKDSSIGNIMRQCFHEVFSEHLDINSTTAEKLFYDTAKKQYGQIDSEHPLIIATAFAIDYSHQNDDIVIDFKKMLSKHCKVPFTLVCFSDSIKRSTIKRHQLNVIPLSKNAKNDRSIWKNEIFRKDLTFPKKSTVVYVDIDKVFDSDISFLRDCKVVYHI